MTPDALPATDLLAEVCSLTGLAEGTVRGICGGLTANGRHRHDRATMIEMTQTWGVAFETVQQLAGLKLEDLEAIKGGIETSALLNCATAQKELAKQLQSAATDDNALARSKVFSAIAKQQADISSSLRPQGPTSITQINNYSAPDIRELKAMRDRERPARERMEARGVIVETEA